MSMHGPEGSVILLNARVVPVVRIVRVGSGINSDGMSNSLTLPTTAIGYIPNSIPTHQLKKFMIGCLMMILEDGLLYATAVALWQISSPWDPRTQPWTLRVYRPFGPFCALISENARIPIIQKWVLLWRMSDKMKPGFRLDFINKYYLGGSENLE